ncbi:MAG: endonuclease/exonuclease/phosphatase family protein [Chlamydiales bacterium]
MKNLFVVFLTSIPLLGSDFTLSSYNCGGLSEDYDYIRAVAMHKIMQERHNQEPELMAEIEEIERAALQGRAFDQHRFLEIVAPPANEGSPNTPWYALSTKMVTDYRTRPVQIMDKEVREILVDQVNDLTEGDNLTEARRVMARRIFAHELKYDILTLQETDYLDATLFPDHMEALFSPHHNGVVWNVNLFDLVEATEVDRDFCVKLQNRKTRETILVVSGHITGCNPFVGGDSEKGDQQLHAILDYLNAAQADIKVIGMDSNVTATHPRLALLIEAGFVLDREKYLEPTCTNPWQILNTRLDWIAVKGATISNIPVLGVGLNSPQTNMSDHKPIAARITKSPCPA